VKAWGRGLTGLEMVKSAMEELGKRPKWRQGWENLGYSLCILSSMSECNPISNLARPGPSTAKSRPVELEEDTDVDTKERPWRQEVSELVEEPGEEGVECDNTELGQGTERQHWDARALVRLATSHSDEVLDVELIAPQPCVNEPIVGNVDKGYTDHAQETSEGRPRRVRSPEFEDLQEHEQNIVDDVEEPVVGNVDKGYTDFAQETSGGRPWRVGSPEFEDLQEHEQNIVDDVEEPVVGNVDKGYTDFAQETSGGRPWRVGSPEFEDLQEHEQNIVDDVELVHHQAPYPEREIMASEDVELSSTTADDNSSCEIKSVDTEELLDHGMDSRSPQSGTSATGRQNFPRGDSMKDLGQTVRDDIGVKVHGIADGGVSSYVVRGDTRGLFLGGLAVKSVHLDALWQLSTCRLKEVSLAANKIEKIDLSALSHCQDLETLYLQRNRLCRIDLAPLADCRKLEKVWLQSNELIEIDLGPLKACTNLRSLYLEDNRLGGSIDLTPLGHIPQLRSLSLKRNRLTGPIVVTPLLSCPDLISCSVDIGVPLVADAAQKDCLPMGLQKHASIIKWETEERMQRRSQSNANIKLHALLIGFQKNSSSQEITSIMEKYGGFTVSVFEKSVSTVSALKMFDVFIVKLPFLRPHLEEIRAHVPTTPFVLIGSSKDISSVYSFPAERVFEDRLTAQDALEVRDLTRKVIDDDFMVCTALPATAGAENEVILSFNEEQRKALDLTLSQSRVEELTVENIFRKNDSRVTEEIFRHIARVCYLPVCAAGILYEAVKRDKIKHGASSPEVIDYESFSRYWSARYVGIGIVLSFS